MAPDSFPNAQVPSEADSAASSKKWVGELTSSSKKWVADAMKAWTEEDFAKVAVLAPLAVEHLGKAVLWKINPVLVVPLSQDSEQSLMGLATKPDLADPRLRTIGLSALLRRLDQVMGALPIDRKKCSRMVEVRNGAIHVGSPAYSRYVLLDSLALIKSLLENLDEDPEAFSETTIGALESYSSSNAPRSVIKLQLSLPAPGSISLISKNASAKRPFVR
jgi:hypothetical protein